MPEDYRPWTWKAPEGSAPADGSMPRQDAYDKISGRAVFTRDIELPGMLYAKILASPYAHAKIARIDTSEAEKLVGVRDILQFDDPEIATDNVTGGYVAREYNILTLPRTADFYQHPMGVAVVADSEEICDRALRLIQIEWEERPFVLDMEESLKPEAPRLMPEVLRLNSKAKDPNTVVTRDTEIGNVQKGFAEADKIIEYTITRPFSSPAGVEAMACVAHWRGEFLDIWTHHPANLQAVLSSESIPSIAWEAAAFRGRTLLNLPDSEGRHKSQPPFREWNKITLTFPYQGAWYGGIAWMAYSVSFIRLAVKLARRADNRPVKLLYDESNFYCNGDDEGTYRCKVGAQKDGTITALDWHVIGVIGDTPFHKTHESTGIPNIRCTQEWALTNKGHAMCWRHGSQCCVPHNAMFDRVAAEFGLDPTEVALKNDGCREHYWDWVTKYQKENGFPRRQSLREIIELGKKAIDWDRKWHAPGAKKLANGRMHGMGFTSVNEWGWMAGRNMACLVLRNGKLTIIGKRADFGMDTGSGFRRCVASEAGLRYEDTVIQMQQSDASTFSFAIPGGSMGTINTTPQLVVAARQLKRKILEYAVRPRPGMVPGRGQSIFPGKTIENLDVRDGFVFEKANPENKKSVDEVASPFWGDDPAIVHPVVPQVTSLTLDGKSHPTFYIMSRQAHFIEVEVDTETGEVLVTNVVCVNDLGHLFNRPGAEAQQYGGAVMGLGRSATEEKIYCPRTGVGLNFDNVNYYLGTMNDYPAAQCILNESHLGYSAYGACGIGEDSGAAMSGITAGAIYNATGKWILDYPLIPNKVLEALGKI